MRPDGSAGVQAVPIAAFLGRIGSIGRPDCCQTVVTLERARIDTSMRLSSPPTMI
jgi:hypothetical protein